MTTASGSRPGEPRPTPAPSGPASRGPWLLVYALLAPTIVVPLVVGLYDREEPAWAGIPFFFWFQFLLIPCAAVLTVAAFVVAKSAERRDREARQARARGEKTEG